MNTISGDPGIWIGGVGAWLVKINNGHALSLGGGGYGLSSDHPLKSMDYTKDYSLNIGYGGAIIGYYNHSYRLFHFGFSA